MRGKQIISLLFVLSITLSGFAQRKGRIGKADSHFAAGEYTLAIEKYLKAYDSNIENEEKIYITYKLAEAYRFTNYAKKAEAWYKKAIKKEYPEPTIYLYCADAMKQNEKYEKAIENYEKYKELMPDDPRADLGIESCELSLRWKESPNGYEITDVKFFNTKQPEYSPVFTNEDYSEVYFTSSRKEATGSTTHGGTGYNFADIFVSKKDKSGVWSEPIPISEEINTEVEEGACAITSDLKTLYFTRCNVDKKDKLGSEIFVSKRDGEEWGKPESLKIAADSFVVAHPALSPDDLKLYFTSDMPGGQGGKDLWVMSRESAGGEWGSPENLGPEINTPGNEMFPFVHADGTLYFSSDYHIGMGGLDIFKLVEEDGNKVIKNMRYPVNSPADDFGIVFEADREAGFFSSTRNGHRKSDDIFAFYLPPLKFSVEGTVFDERKETPLAGVKVRLYGNDGTNIQATTSEKGTFKFMLKPSTDYVVSGSKKGYLNGKARETTKGLTGSKEFDMSIYMTSIDKPIELENILYDLGKFDLRPESLVALDKLVEILRDNPSITIELGSHTDSRGSDAVNIELSQKRAEAVVQYLIGNTIPSDRLEARGYAATEPRVVDMKTAKRYDFLKEGDVLTQEYIDALASEEQKEVAYQLNRRTEFKVLRTDYKK